MLFRIQFKLLVINFSQVKQILDQCFKHIRTILLLSEHLLDHFEVHKEFVVGVLLELLSDNELLLHVRRPMFIDDVAVFHALEPILDQFLEFNYLDGDLV